MPSWIKTRKEVMKTFHSTLYKNISKNVRVQLWSRIFNQLILKINYNYTVTILAKVGVLRFQQTYYR